jgi:hypothetical protein
MGNPILGTKLPCQVCILVHDGEYQGDRYAYIDANEKLKLVLELLEND